MPIDPLQRLRDIALPDPVSLWPPAPGWWLLAVFSLVAIAAGLYLWQRQRRANAYRKAAAKALDQAWTDYQQRGDKAVLLQQLVTLLRRTALQGFPDQAVAGMHGAKWLSFLDATSRSTHEKAFGQGGGQILLSAPYQRDPEIDPAPLFKLVKDWVLTHQSTYTASATDTPSSGGQEVTGHA